MLNIFTPLHGRGQDTVPPLPCFTRVNPISHRVWDLRLAMWGGPKDPPPYFAGIFFFLGPKFRQFLACLKKIHTKISWAAWNMTHTTLVLNLRNGQNCSFIIIKSGVFDNQMVLASTILVQMPWNLAGRFSTPKN